MTGSIISKMDPTGRFNAGVDGVEMLVNQISKDLRPLRDALVALGLIFATKTAITLTFKAIRWARHFLLPHIWPKSDMRKKYGSHACKMNEKPAGFESL